MTTTNQPGGGTVVPIHQGRPLTKARRGDSPEARVRRDALRCFLGEHQISAAELARRAGIPTPISIYNLLNGHSASLSQRTIERVLRVFPGAAHADITGSGEAAMIDGVSAAATPSIVPLLAETGIRPAGETAVIGRVPVPAMPAAPGTGLFAISVTADGGESLFPAGSLLVCRRLTDSIEDLPDGTVIVLRIRGDGWVRVELRTTRHFEGQLWLWPHSPDPAQQLPLPAPAPLATPVRLKGGVTVAALGSVVASWQFAGPTPTP
jgi:hypothetical protein